MDHDLTTLWLHVLKNLEPTISKGKFITVLKPTHLVSFDANIATVSAPSAIMLNMLKPFEPELVKQLSELTEQSVRLEFVVKATAPGTSKTKPSPLFAEEPTLVNKSPAASKLETNGLSIGHLPRVRPDYTFSNFAVSSSNQLAFTAAQTVAGSIGTAYNPLFIYGPVGVGKTHLMHAIANDVYQKDPAHKIIYITSEEFTNEVIDAIRTNDTARMKRRFRSCSLLLIDDIQFIEGKERVQEELFHTFNILIDNGAQIALSSDRPPQEIKKLEKRLSSRFAGGLTVDIEAPDFELKTAILQKKAEKFGRELPIEIAKIIADNATDTRSLEGMLLRVITQATMQGTEITSEIAQQAFGALQEEQRGSLHSEDVIQAVCAFYGVKQTQLRGQKRDAAIVRARQVAMYLLKTELKITLVEIGDLLGGRDHTTIMHGVDKITALVENEGPIKSDIRGITKTLHE